MAEMPSARHYPLMTGVNLIVAADEPAIFFASVKEAERWIEPIDVENGGYTAAFGPGGEPYEIITDGRRVTIQATGGPPQPAALKAILLQFFAVNDECIGSDMTLSALLDRCEPSYR